MLYGLDARGSLNSYDSGCYDPMDSCILGPRLNRERIPGVVDDGELRYFQGQSSRLLDNAIRLYFPSGPHLSVERSVDSRAGSGITFSPLLGQGGSPRMSVNPGDKIGAGEEEGYRRMPVPEDEAGLTYGYRPGDSNRPEITAGEEFRPPPDNISARVGCSRRRRAPARSVTPRKDESLEKCELRRATHRRIEKKRREAISRGINNLAKLLTPLCERNKGDILNRAAEYIRHLERQRESDDKEISGLSAM